MSTSKRAGRSPDESDYKLALATLKLTVPYMDTSHVRALSDYIDQILVERLGKDALRLSRGEGASWE